MSVRRIQGTEVEYGISVIGDPYANPMFASTALVNAYRGLTESGGNRWDYAEESPLRDARGFDLARRYADPSLLTDEDIGMANLILTNGARLYVDHAHPEFSGPEVLRPRDVVVWEKAGEQIMARAAEALQTYAGHPGMVLYKNNTDGKGASYGAHENFLVQRATPFGDLVTGLIPFLVSRQIVCGAGRVGIGQASERAGFQISQRADYFETEIGLETTMRRPLINTRDEPHADPELWRRLHVIIGDANLSETQILLKSATTSIVLAMIEAGAPLPEISLAQPVQALHQISHDPALSVAVECRDGSTITALEIQERYYEAAIAFCGDADPETSEALALWGEVLMALREDPRTLSDRLDWVAKWHLLQAYADRDGLAWDHAKLAAIDLQYADIRPDKGLYHRLVHTGRMRTLVPVADVQAAVHAPPVDTRAYFRGECMRKYAASVVAASWDSVIVEPSGGGPLHRIATLDPLRGTREHVEALVAGAPTVDELIAALGS